MVTLLTPDPEDLDWLCRTVSDHLHWTGSTVAASMLADWPRRSALFTKVMPVDYQRVLEATRLARAEGLDVDTAIMEAARG
jgi:glutamate synthase (NADPH/NADH) large chain